MGRGGGGVKFAIEISPNSTVKASPLELLEKENVLGAS